MFIEPLGNPYKVQHFSFPSDLMKSSCWLDESLSSTTNVLFQGIYQLLKDATLVTSNLKTPHRIWNLKPSSIGRAAKFVNHPDNLSDTDFSVDKPSDNQTGTEPKYNMRRAIKAPTKLDF